MIKSRTEVVKKALAVGSQKHLTVLIKAIIKDNSVKTSQRPHIGNPN